MSYGFYMPARILGGKGIVRESAAKMAALGKSALIVTGGSSAKMSGAVNDVTAALDSVGVKWEIFDKITPNPLVSDCYEAGKQAIACKAEFLVGIGGGSPLDSAKAVAIFAANPSLEAEAIYGGKFENAPLPLVLVGTTAGTGSEISAVSVLTDSKGKKRSVKGDFGFAKIVLADYSYTSSCPLNVTVSTALDAFMHAVEGWFSPKLNEPARAFAAQCIPIIYAELVKFHNGEGLPNENGRERLYHASLDAGFTLNYCGTLFPHPVGYILTEHYGIPHGRACAAFFDKLIVKANSFAQQRAAELTQLLGTDEKTMVKTITDLADCSNIVISPEQARAYAERWEQPPMNFICTPGGFTAKEGADCLAGLSK